MSSKGLLKWGIIASRFFLGWLEFFFKVKTFLFHAINNDISEETSDISLLPAVLETEENSHEKGKKSKGKWSEKEGEW